jgi:ABC-type antimicrobial peptide transport system permease subunit
MQSIERLGTNLLFVFHKTLMTEEQRKFAGRSTGQRYDDALALKSLHFLLRVAPILQFNQQLRAGDRDFSGQVTGTLPQYQEVRNFRVASGRFLSQQDLDEWRRVAVLGKDVASRLFGTDPPLHRDLKIGDERFVVIGVVGGLTGVVYGIALAHGFGDLVARAMPGGGDWGAIVQIPAVLASFSYAVAVGVFFGLYPALKASKLDPAEALRYR